MTADEQNTLIKLRSGDLLVFELLFDNYYTMLCNIANGYLNSKQQAEEVVCDVFYKIWENRDSLEIHTSIKAYLIRAVCNRSINYQEQNKSAPYYLEDHENMHYTDGTTPLSYLLANDLEVAINQAIDSLPAACREIFCMSRFDNLKYEEIARKQAISVNTVKTQMKIALQKLREILTPYLPLPER